MCAGALVMSRLGRCVFCAADPEMGCCGSVYDLPADDALHSRTRWEQGGPEEACRTLLTRSFAQLRPKGGTK
jgi:tRNA(adenine34) deaminase